MNVVIVMVERANPRSIPEIESCRPAEVPHVEHVKYITEVGIKSPRQNTR